ncbi:AraC family transcriptional regulator [Paenibacillus sp. ACRRY]|uniref:AraC family transcriptional regulator n=1 Tax=Paenibacillus sp. ACRRY TaxID=2918208 RepID=UPI001EF4E32D|nr:AraC family transcriptional regulator [Paenibacillus sp. ACRRY]MCG7381366.1 AraC family transcriptional regulator [Paenibacillus sp. ACRRY]
MIADNSHLDQTLYEKIQHGHKDFPIQFYIDELYQFKNLKFPLHWHFEPEFFIAQGGPLRAQIGNQILELNPGDGIFVNGNTLHSFEQIHNHDRCKCPNIVFSAEMIAPHSSIIYQKYVWPILANSNLPYFVLYNNIPWHKEILNQLSSIFSLLHQYGLKSPFGDYPDIDLRVENVEEDCFEMQVQRILNQIWQSIYKHQELIPKINQTLRDVQHQVRLQKMLTFIHQNYMNEVSLQDISLSANISKSEASRCFHALLNCSPIDYLLQHRVESSKRLLCHTTLNIQDISLECGFNSPSYFIKVFKRKAGMTPREYRAINII